MNFLSLVNACAEGELGRLILEEAHGGSSCHQCKSRRNAQDLTFCSSSAKRHKCKKKYCNHCLTKFYQELPPAQKDQVWTCPFCRDLCCCAACRRKEAAITSPLCPSSPRFKPKHQRRSSDPEDGPAYKKSRSPLTGFSTAVSDPEILNLQAIEGAKLLAGLLGDIPIPVDSMPTSPARPISVPRINVQSRPQAHTQVQKIWTTLGQIDSRFTQTYSISNEHHITSVPQTSTSIYSGPVPEHITPLQMSSSFSLPLEGQRTPPPPPSSPYSPSSASSPTYSLPHHMAPRPPCQCAECVHGPQRGTSAALSNNNLDNISAPRYEANYFPVHVPSQPVEFREQEHHCSCCSHRNLVREVSWDRSSEPGWKNHSQVSSFAPFTSHYSRSISSHVSRLESEAVYENAYERRAPFTPQVISTNI